MHIKSLRLVNFKSHKDSYIEFSQITSIVGRNSAGKSNIFRALKLLLHHTDWPESWIRYKQDHALIEVELFDGTKVSRKRTKSSQSVTITQDGVTTVYEGKKDATEFIQKAIGIKKVTLDETSGPEDLNFVEVYDPPYLISGRADTVQRKIAGIVGANAIDDAKTRLAKELRSVDSNLTNLNKIITDLESNTLNSRRILENIENKINTLKNLNDKRDDKSAKFKNLNDFYHVITSSTYNVGNNVSSKMKKLKELEDELKIKRALFDSTTQILSDIEDINKKKNVSDRIKKDLLSVKNTLSSLAILATTSTLLQEYEHTTESIQQKQEYTKACITEIAETKKAKDSCLKKLGVCPVCENKIKNT